MGMIWIHHH